MGKNKNKCSKCNERHYPPTGKNSKIVTSSDSEEEVVVLSISMAAKKNKKSVKDNLLGKKVINVSESLLRCLPVSSRLREGLAHC